MSGTTCGWILRSEQALCLQLSEKETLDYGIAYYSERFRDHPEANQFREMLIEDESRTEEAVEQAEAWFHKRGLTCHRWAPAEIQNTERLAPILSARGYRDYSFIVMALTKWVDWPASPHVRVLPARAMRAVYRETLDRHELISSGVDPTLVRRVCEERLDDAPYEMMVALVDRTPAGRCGLYQVGDIARVMDLSVLPEFANRGVSEALLANVLALAKRLMMRNVCCAVPSTATETVKLLQMSGFVVDGEIIEFHRT